MSAEVCIFFDLSSVLHAHPSLNPSVCEYSYEDSEEGSVASGTSPFLCSTTPRRKVLTDSFLA